MTGEPSDDYTTELTADLSDDLHRALAESQRLGFLGDRPIDDVVEHARAFVAALDGVNGNVIDLGAGGGIPGLVIAHDRPDLTLTLVDRRMKRTDFLERVVRRLHWGSRVTVVHADVEDVIRRDGAIYSAAVARGFGPPATTLRLGTQLVRAGGRVLVSEPPTGDRWVDDDLAAMKLHRLMLDDHRVAGFQIHE